jgi:hypothetical protein
MYLQIFQCAAMLQLTELAESLPKLKRRRGCDNNSNAGLPGLKVWVEVESTCRAFA